MTQSLSSGLTSVTGTVTSTETKINLTTLSASRSAAGTTILGTVPANKVWRIIAVSVGLQTPTTTGDYFASVQLNGSLDLCYTVTRGLATYGCGGVANSQTWSYYACPVLTAGQTLGAYLAGGGYATYSAQYYEEAA